VRRGETIAPTQVKMRSTTLLSVVALISLGCSIEGRLGGPGLDPEAHRGNGGDEETPLPGGGGGTSMGGSEGSEEEPGPGEIPHAGGGSQGPDGQGGALGSGGQGAGGGAQALPNQVCYPGENQDDTTCFPTILQDASFPSGYSYPSTSSPAYAAPTRFIDLSGYGASIKLAPNFSLGELMQEWKGRYAIYEPHMVVKLQSMRDQSGGALSVNSGYRSPGYNAGVDGATYSRHMYGDAADMASSVVSLNAMKGLCEGLNADYIGMYTSHIHCDWRYTAKDPAFSNTTAPFSAAPVAPAHDASFSAAADGTFHADITGFEEGEAYREWTAFDANGEIVEVVASQTYRPPSRARSVEVMVGGQLTISVADVSAPSMWQASAGARVRLETLPTEDLEHER